MVLKEKKFIQIRMPRRSTGVSEKPGRNIVAALDIGSSKICCFIAEIGAHGAPEVIGIGHQAARGVKSGTIIDLKAAEAAVAHAIEGAEMMAKSRLQGQPIKSVFLSAPGVHTIAHPLSVDVRVSGHAVIARDITAALSHARSAVDVAREELIHVIPANFSLDGSRGIQDPLGMVGYSLHVDITAITGLSNSLRNLKAIAGQNHLDVDGFCSAAYASGLAVLSEDEMQLGCCVIDMGGGTTSIAVFFGGKLVYTSAIPVGGQHVTSDIARGLTTSLSDAERIKTLYGSAQSIGMDNGAMIDVPPIGEEEHSQPNYVPRSLLTGIIQPRIEETFEMVRAKLVDSGVNQIAGRGVVLTGGASQLPGLREIGQLILDKQIRLGRPHRVRGLAEATGGPAFSTAAGILLYATEHSHEMPAMRKSSALAVTPFNNQLLQKVTHWLKENW